MGCCFWRGLALHVLCFNAVVRYPVNAAPADDPSAASFFVPNLPDIIHDENHPFPHIYAGHIASDPHSEGEKDDTAHLFFVLVKARRSADKERIMFWFNGGPGCSSFDGLMMENGPWRANEQGGFTVTEGGWEEYTNIVYVDQPAGTGYSYPSVNKVVKTQIEATEQLIEFLHNFYKVFPVYQTMDTYLGGESFAGQFIPYFAEAILNAEDLKIPLRGATIGNGWIDGRTQYPSYLEYGLKEGLFEPDSELHKSMIKDTDACIAHMDKVTGKDTPYSYNCGGLLGKALSMKDRTVNGRKMCGNVYDVRLEDTVPACGMNWPPPIHNYTRYLQRSDVQRALHATSPSVPKPWTECRGRVRETFERYNDHTVPSSIYKIPGVLEKIPMLFFSGDKDLICNYIGQERMIENMTWNGATGLDDSAQTLDYAVNGTAAGTWVTSRNLTYVRLYNGSHMVPFDLPHVTHDMILRWMGMDFSKLLDGSARIPSSVGGQHKAVYTVGAPEEGVIAKVAKTAYHNAGWGALFVVIVASGVSAFCCWRGRRRESRRNARDALERDAQGAEETFPLNESAYHDRARDDVDDRDR